MTLADELRLFARIDESAPRRDLLTDAASHIERLEKNLAALRGATADQEGQVLAIARANFEKQMREDCPRGEEPEIWPTPESIHPDVWDAYLSEARDYLGHIQRAGLVVLGAAEVLHYKEIKKAATCVVLNGHHSSCDWSICDTDPCTCGAHFLEMALIPEIPEP